MKRFRFRYVVWVILFAGVGWGVTVGGDHLFEKWRFSRDYKLAIAGNSNAQNIVGVDYQNGEIVTQNDALAVQWYLKAAEQGHAKAQHNLAWMYDEGRGVEQDYHKAIQWYLKAAEQNYANSMVSLGIMYAHGQGIEWDKQKALYWYQKGAELGNRMAQHHLADLYLNGYVENKDKFFAKYEKKTLHRRVPEDKAKARYWLEKSAQQGYAESQYKLAMIYFDEKGRFGRDAEAVRWFKKAGSNGIAKGYTMAAVMYLDGRGVAKSTFHSLRYSLLALKSGDLDAGKVIMALTLGVVVK